MTSPAARTFRADTIHYGALPPIPERLVRASAAEGAERKGKMLGP